ncbi:MAG: Hsp20/alpha crystallin family protein [Patescibacteria group bacterium]
MFFRFFGPEGGLGDNLPRAASAGLNIYEVKGEVVVEAPVPGVKKSEITVEVAEGTVKIDAVHTETEEDKKERQAIYRAQRMSEFHYSASLPKEVKEDEAKAKLEDGVLTVRIPIKAESRSKKPTVTIEGE